METSGRPALMASLIENSYLEIVPLPGIEDRLESIPGGAYVAISCSPTKGVEPTLTVAERLARRGFRLVPHIAARMVRDRAHLRDILQRLTEARIQSVFIPGGDAPVPLGDYGNALELLRDMAEIGHGMADVGVAAHPEGHPLVSDAGLVSLLLEKQALSSYLVTQMCFDAALLIRWLGRIRRAGVTLPAWIGLPGVADHARLFALSMKLGVGTSARILLRQKGLLKKMAGLRPYQPDDLVDGLASCVDDASAGLRGFHLFSFNDIGRTERWRRETLMRYRSPAARTV